MMTQEMENENKFQYLNQAKTEGSRVCDIICSFPPTSKNYEKAIEGLHSRFGREDLLIEFYIHEHLSLVVQNVSKTKFMLYSCTANWSHTWYLSPCR
jgi:hypothetical protein